MPAFPTLLFFGAGYVCGISFASVLIGSFVRSALYANNPPPMLFVGIVCVHSLAMVMGLTLIFGILVIGDVDDRSDIAFKAMAFLAGTVVSISLLVYSSRLMSRHATLSRMLAPRDEA